MVGTMQKIKNALTPGHHNTTGTTGTGYTGTDYNTAGTGYNTAGTGYTGTHTAQVPVPAGTPVHVEVGPGLGGAAPMGATGLNTAGMGTTEAVNRTSVYSSTSSESDVVARHDVAGVTCNVREFTEVEDRPIVKERVERIVEHVPVEKKFIVETRPVGETVLAANATVESMGVTETVVERAAGTTCPTPGAIDRAIGGVGATTTYDACAGGRC